ncbi:MAG TPA: hypothetical protein VM287_08995 [Egibacteraceae bacterium]|nr:hypothetical protein [Egibacteraceae bacterium]
MGRRHWLRNNGPVSRPATAWSAWWVRGFNTISAGLSPFPTISSVGW